MDKFAVGISADSHSLGGRCTEPPYSRMKEARSYSFPSLRSILTSIFEFETVVGELVDDVEEKWELGEIARAVGDVDVVGVAHTLGEVVDVGV